MQHDMKIMENYNKAIKPLNSKFQLTMSDQSIKLQDKTARLCDIPFMNKFIKISYRMPRPFSEDLRWRAILMKEMLEYQVDELVAA